MNTCFLQLIDYFFVAFHTALILFNLTGWIWRRARLWNLVSLLLTGASWLLLGIFYGLGYCPLTDWHFNVLRKLGETRLPLSYIKYLAERLSGLSPSAQLVDAMTLAGYLVALALSVYFNFFVRRGQKTTG